MSNVEDGNVNAIDESTLPVRAVAIGNADHLSAVADAMDRISLAIYEGVVAELGDPFVEPEVKDKRTRSQRQHAVRKARKAADEALANTDNPFANQ